MSNYRRVKVKNSESTLEKTEFYYFFNSEKSTNWWDTEIVTSEFHIATN